MKHGKFICPAIPAVTADGSTGEWTEKIYPNPDANTPVALKYVDGAGNIHPFTRNGWFMTSNFATKQTAPGAEEATDDTATATDISGTVEGKSNW